MIYTSTISRLVETAKKTGEDITIGAYFDFDEVENQDLLQYVDNPLSVTRRAFNIKRLDSVYVVADLKK